MYREYLTKNFLFRNPNGTLIYVWLYVNRRIVEGILAPHFLMQAYEIQQDCIFTLHTIHSSHFPTNQEVKAQYGVKETVLISDTPEETGLEYQIKYLPESLSYAEQAICDCFTAFLDKFTAIQELRSLVSKYAREKDYINFVTVMSVLREYNQSDVTIYAMADYIREKCDQSEVEVDLVLSEIIIELFGKDVSFSRNYWLYSRAGIVYQKRVGESTETSFI